MTRPRVPIFEAHQWDATLRVTMDIEIRASLGAEESFLQNELLSNAELRAIARVLPGGKPRQWNARQLVESMVGSGLLATDCALLDLGCGDGRGYSHFSRSHPGFSYVGVDIEDSPEVRSRKELGADFFTFDGRKLPFSRGSFDIVFSEQVFEHVENPDKLLASVFEVLKVGGYFIGSVAYLEPYHSLSLQNFTPVGLFRKLTKSGFDPIFLGAGVDGKALVDRSIRMRKSSNSIWDFSPLNASIAEDESLTDLAKKWKMLKFAGHIVFGAKKSKPDGA